ncbi:hypothetical protein CALVIDRAFT_561681 [Calocera viscosa TUFC12733]|uniref:Uncharacterized protein n=1 Tax=Calocera viscosa (strain TUFC12733) TaxID=1330018 RepID=A0A167PFA7_CALVF|nr:hypothetical protein CALVIDRAFT_561681 [Calocera viscosa TUFC12733]
MQILSLLVAQWPEAAMSMQNRIKPMEWFEVLEIVSAFDAVSSEVLNRVRQRMGASGDERQLAVERRKIVERSNARLLDLEKLYEDDLFEVPELPASDTEEEPQRKRVKRRELKTLAVSESTTCGSTIRALIWTEI